MGEYILNLVKVGGEIEFGNSIYICSCSECNLNIFFFFEAYNEELSLFSFVNLMEFLFACSFLLNVHCSHHPMCLNKGFSRIG